MDDFEKNLQRLKRLAPVATVCMYGRPLSPYDNRDMFKIDENHDRLIRQLHVLGEVYLDIDYEDITHTSKTGRNRGQIGPISLNPEFHRTLPADRSCWIICESDCT
jgi:hypothetical protein